MNIFFKLFLLLPLIEIIGFIAIGGEIGLGLSLLWLMGAAALGTYVLRGHGGIWSRVQTADDDLFVVEGMFDAVCLLLAGLLLIFPGFISDFLALPLLAPHLRRLFFQRIQKNPDGFIRRHARFNQKTRHGSGMGEETTIIEAEYTEIDPAAPAHSTLPPEPPQHLPPQGK